MAELTPSQIIQNAKRKLIQAIVTDLADVNPKGEAAFADNGNRKSVNVAWEWLRIVNGTPPQWQLNHVSGKRKGQESGNKFETLVTEFIEESYIPLAKEMFGDLGQKVERYTQGGSEEESVDSTAGASFFSKFYQYHGLETLAAALKKNPQLAASLGNIYEVRPDIVVHQKKPLDEAHRVLTACVSCKWTIRSDRVQNTRVEARNLLNNRVARAPQIVAITVEPLPSRLKAIASGTGEIDCTYHVDLPALKLAVENSTRFGLMAKWNSWSPKRRSAFASDEEFIRRAMDDDVQLSTLNMLTTGRRIKDILELPADLLM